jgi:hypothetical protein
MEKQKLIFMQGIRLKIDDSIVELTTIAEKENSDKIRVKGTPSDPKPLSSETGACWWCSYQYAMKDYTSWYDNNGYYRYCNTCWCSQMMGCGSHGSVENGYCSHCGATYPTVTISKKTNRWGGFTYHSHCSVCQYDVYYYY